MIINEKYLLTLLDTSYKVFLFEPNYDSRYIPLGLAKIASYLENQHKVVEYNRYYTGFPCDLVCISSMFTYDLEYVLNAIAEIRAYSNVPIIVGGVCASLLSDKFPHDVHVFAGCSVELDKTVPTYDMFDYRVAAPWNNFNHVFTTRGCVNRCAYCAVWRLEPEHYVVDGWEKLIYAPCKEHTMISDNNLSSFPEEHVTAVVDYLAYDSKPVIFDNGFDCKYITKTLATNLARLKYYKQGLRLAFDRIDEDGVFQSAVNMLLDGAIIRLSIMAYVLFNFKDTLSAAHYRASECRKLGIKPFPQQYCPLTWTSRSKLYVGKHWSIPLIRAFRHYWREENLYQDISLKQFAIDHDDIYQFSKKDKDKISLLP